MSDGLAELPRPEIKLESEKKPVGFRVVGLVDPRTLSPEEFSNSPELLYHGCAKDFKFDSRFDYSSDVILDSDGSWTLGEGFYMTESRNEAENYSRVRQYKDSADAKVISLLPFEAKLLDLRDRENLDNNVPVPVEFVQSWQQFYKDILEKRDRSKDLSDIKEIEDDYLKYLNDVSGVYRI
ncbi:MAG: hypothetical protein Q8P53_00980 [Candidatus Shapirobacteria bacterium]|nr:hypothetical protein [Candidatus Shapirobacteria bacterium]